MRFVRIITFASTLACCFAYADKFPKACTAPQFPTSKATAIDGKCGLGGTPGSPETSQNQAKNNFCAEGPAKPITIVDLAQLQLDVQENKSINFGNDRDHPLSDSPGPTTDRTPLAALGEGNEVVLQGFILIARQESGESVNCGKAVPDKAVNHDIHLSIVDSAANRVECSSVVVEMSPHHRPATWTAAAAKAVSAAHLPVRVTGQLFFDSSHTPCQAGAPLSGDPSRSSLWEVHPVYKFEVCTQGDCSSGTGWTPLESWKAPKSKKAKKSKRQ